MKESLLQFSDPQLINITYKSNENFNAELFKGISIESKTTVNKSNAENIAIVNLQLSIGDEMSPFSIDILMGLNLNGKPH